MTCFTFCYSLVFITQNRSSPSLIKQCLLQEYGTRVLRTCTLTFASFSIGKLGVTTHVKPLPLLDIPAVVADVRSYPISMVLNTGVKYLGYKGVVVWYAGQQKEKKKSWTLQASAHSMHMKKQIPKGRYSTQAQHWHSGRLTLRGPGAAKLIRITDTSELLWGLLVEVWNTAMYCYPCEFLFHQTCICSDQSVK